jgi:HlyD family secretion protein
MKRFLISIASALVLAGLVAYGAWSYVQRSAAPANEFQMTQVKLGDVVSKINSTGTLEPEEVIDVGAQVAGQILSFGKDARGKPVDYGSFVKEGTVLAQIDSSLYISDVAQAQAALAQAQANVQRAEADLGQMQAKLEQADHDWKRAQELGPSDALAQSSYDAYKAAYETAKANLAVGEAVVVQDKGAVVQAQAALDRAQRNLSYCTIVSPVDGVIIDRRVNIGQTVVSSLNAPSLFLIAKDLRRMQVWVSVNEADIGSIHAGQPVTFTVDALPGQTFYGKVAKIRLNATMTQNVVTYTVEVRADNSSGKLLPYLTANVQFEVARRTNVLTVANAALRWSPRPEQIAPEFQDNLRTNSGQRGGSAGARTSAGSATATPAARPGLLWLKAENGLQPLRGHTGLSDGNLTEVQGDGLKEGLEVVTGATQRGAPPPEANANPFTPQINRGGQGSRGGR